MYNHPKNVDWTLAERQWLRKPVFFVLVLSGDQIRSKVAMENHYLLLFIEFIDVFPT